MSIPHNGRPASAAADRASVWRLACRVTVSVLIHTLMGALVGEKTTFLYKEALHLTASQITVLNLVLGLPTYLQPFFGAWTEIIPWLGYHRRTYYGVGILISVVGYLALALLQPYHLYPVAILMLTKGMGLVLSMVVYNAVFVAIGNRTGALPRLQTLTVTLPLVLGAVYTSHLAGFVAENWTYAHAYGATAALAALLLPLTLLMEDTRVPHGAGARLTAEALAVRAAHRKQSTLILKQALRSPGLWIYTAYIAYNALTPDPVTARVYYMTDSLHFSKQFIGDLGRWQAWGTLLGLGLVALLARFMSLRVATLWSWLGNCMIYLCYFGIQTHLSAKCAYLLIGFDFALLGVLGTTLTARACPRGAEGTVFGLIASVNAFFYLICDYWGTKMYDIYGPLNKAHHYTVVHGWNTSVAIGLAFAVAQGLFLPFLPAWTRSRASLSAPQTEEDA